MALDGTMSAAPFPMFANQRSFAVSTSIGVADVSGVLWADATVGTPVVTVPAPTIAALGSWVLIAMVVGTSIDVTPAGGVTLNDAGATISVAGNQALWLFSETPTNWAAMFAA